MNILNLFGPSWKTTVAGIAAVLGALAHLADAIANGKPVDFTVTITGIMSGLGLIFARDNKVSSEDVGLNK